MDSSLRASRFALNDGVKGCASTQDDGVSGAVRRAHNDGVSGAVRRAQNDGVSGAVRRAQDDGVSGAVRRL